MAVLGCSNWPHGGKNHTANHASQNQANCEQTTFSFSDAVLTARQPIVQYYVPNKEEDVFVMEDLCYIGRFNPLPTFDVPVRNVVGKGQSRYQLLILHGERYKKKKVNYVFFL